MLLKNHSGVNDLFWWHLAPSEAGLLAVFLVGIVKVSSTDAQCPVLSMLAENHHNMDYSQIIHDIKGMIIHK